MDAIGRDHPAPGSGAAAAVALALAAACAAKAAAISLKHQPADVTLQSAVESFAELARCALAGADADAQAFEAFLRARNPDLAVRLIRTDAELASLTDLLCALIGEVESRVDAKVRADLAAARQLAQAARRIHERNIAETESVVPAATASEQRPPKS